MPIDVPLKLDGLALRRTLIFTRINNCHIILSTLQAHSIRSIVHLETTTVVFPLLLPLTLVIVYICALWLAYPRQLHLRVLKDRTSWSHICLIPTMD